MTYEEKIHTLNQPHHFHHWLIFEFISFRSEILLLLIAKLLFRAASKTNITLIHFLVCSLQMSYTEFISRYYWRDLKSRYGNRQTANVRFKFKVFNLDRYEQAVSVLLWKEHEVRNAIAVLRKTRILASFTKLIRKFRGNSITHEWKPFTITIITTGSTLKRLIPKVIWRVGKKLPPSQKVKTRDFTVWLLCFGNFLIWDGISETLNLKHFTSC